MAKPPKKSVPPKSTGSSKKNISTTLLHRLETTLEKKQTVVLYIILGLSLLFSILLFDVKVSEANDDSMYVEGAFHFAEDISNEYAANAPLYPLLLSIPIRMFGLNLIMLKSISVLFTLLHLWIFFLALRKRIPYITIFPVMLIVATNTFIQYFASQTFTEALFLFLQSLLLLLFFRCYDKLKENPSLKKTALSWLAVGFCICLMTLSKNIAIGTIVAIIAFLLIHKKFLPALYAFLGVLFIRIPLDLLRTMVWGSNNQYNNQTSILLQKDPYNAANGYEDAAGFFQRFLDNTQLYIAKRLYQILGFLSIDSTETKGGLIFIAFVFFLLAVIWSIKNKNVYVQFMIIYSLIMMGLTFAVLQKQWDQPRFVLVYLPFILVAVFYGIYSALQNKSSFAQYLYVIPIIIIFFSSFISSTTKASKNFNTLKKNLAGDVYYGYTDDWVNFLKMSRYCADSLPENSYVASRKAPMSFIYGNGKKFYPVYTAFSTDADSIINKFHQDSVTHILLASLRRNPKKIDGYIINTLHRLMQPVVQKYPNRFTLVKQIGETETAYLYKINY